MKITFCQLWLHGLRSDFCIFPCKILKSVQKNVPKPKDQIITFRQLWLHGRQCFLLLLKSQQLKRVYRELDWILCFEFYADLGFTSFLNTWITSLLAEDSSRLAWQDQQWQLGQSHLKVKSVTWSNGTWRSPLTESRTLETSSTVPARFPSGGFFSLKDWRILLSAWKPPETTECCFLKNSKQSNRHLYGRSNTWIVSLFP